MNHCMGAPAEEFLESYLLGTLPESDALKFEEHYFDCPVCLAQVEALQTVARKLRAEPPSRSRSLIPWPVSLAAVGAIAAALLVGFIVMRNGSHPRLSAVAANQAAPLQQAAMAAHKANSPAKSALSQLADLALPAFHAPNLRGENGNPAFVAGMKAYSSQDCPRALTALAQVPATDADSHAAHFFSGICQMHLGDLDAASRSLSAVSDAGDSPQQEAALYYLAQLALARNNAASAHQYLERTLSLHGDFDRRARAQLLQLQEAAGSEPEK